MSNELRVATRTGQNIYCQIVNSDGQRWNTDTEAFETYNASNYSDYSVTLTEQGTSGVYLSDFPSTVTTDGTYEYYGYLRNGATPSEGDVIYGTGKVVWNYSATVASTYSDVSDELRAVTLTGKTIYAHIMNSAGQRWSTVSVAFENYISANYANYDVVLTEQGSTGLYFGTFPSGITTSGTYEYFAYLQDGATPATGDRIINTGKVIWNGSSVVQKDVQGMSAIAFRNYVVNILKRTDKNKEIYEALTDAVTDWRIRFDFSEDQTEKTTTDTITEAGDYRISLNNDVGLIIGEVVLVDSDYSRSLFRVSKAEYDLMEPYPGDPDVTVNTPNYYCIFGNKMYLAPVPDSTDYQYRINYSVEPSETIDADTVSVPFTKYYREALRYEVLGKIYEGLDNEAKADRFYGLADRFFRRATAREKNNRRSQGFVKYKGI